MQESMYLAWGPSSGLPPLEGIGTMLAWKQVPVDNLTGPRGFDSRNGAFRLYQYR